MTKVCIEVCLISARGLSRSSSLWKPQWFVVGWIDPDSKYCTKIDGSGSTNPTWKTKFSVPIDDTCSHSHGLSLTVELYRRDPIFLREKLQGTATVMLKEFFAKFGKDKEASRPGVEGTGSLQLRKRNSGKPRGLIDISVRVFEEREGSSSYSDFNDGFNDGSSYPYSSGPDNETSLAIEDVSHLSFPSKPQPPTQNQFGGYTRMQSSYSYPYSLQTPTPHSTPHPNPSPISEGYTKPPTPPPPPPPSNTGYLPMLFPGTRPLTETYVNLPTRQPEDQNNGLGFGAGLGAGALSAGAVIFGDDFLSASSFSAGFEGGSLVTADPPYWS